MVKIVENWDDIVSLWTEAFDDPIEDIMFFNDNLNNGICIGLYDNELESMVYLIDCKLDGKLSKYIYAACTFKKYRNTGAMTKLLDYCKKNYGSICLIPANKHLIKYYDKRGLSHRYSLNDIEFNESDDIKYDYLFDGCDLDEPIILAHIGE